jgi:hypothetical protein
MKRDECGFDQRTPEAIRLMAVEHVRVGSVHLCHCVLRLSSYDDLQMDRRSIAAGCGTEGAVLQAGDGAAMQFDAIIATEATPQIGNAVEIR